MLPLITSFGLVLQEAMADTDLTTTQITLVIVLNHSIGMLVSMFGGPALKGFGYRKVAVVGAMFIVVGLMLTAVSTDFWQFLVSYSILCCKYQYFIYLYMDSICSFIILTFIPVALLT